MVKILVILLGLFANFPVWSKEDPADSYEHATECPGSNKEDIFGINAGFIRCQCVSYVADKLSELFNKRYWAYRGQINILRTFGNDQYYMPQSSVTRWSDARKWRNTALSVGIGVTGARDNFHWDEKSYNAVFPGDVAWWEKWDYIDSNGVRRKNDYGHVAFVESVEPDIQGKGVACVWLSEYNWKPANDFNRRRVCKTDGGVSFPDAFIHIDRDHAFCAANPSVGNCSMLFGGGYVADNGQKGDGLGGNSSSSFNLKLDFDILDSLSDIEWQAGTHALRAAQTVRLQAEAEAKSGDVRNFMRQGKDRIEVDFYVRLDDGEWFMLPRQYIKANNLRDGKKIEQVLYMVPSGVKQISFKVKLDAEDEVYESNEGDNWSRIETFDVSEGPPTVNLTIAALEVPGSIPIGGEYGVRFALQNTGNSLPTTSIRSVYQIRGPGTSNLWMNQTDDGTDRDDLMPGKLHWEETKTKLRAPTIPGQYEQRVCTDIYQSVPETNEEDNCLTRFIRVTAPPLPDLLITYVGIGDSNDTSIKKGGEKKPTARVRNVGSGPATTRFVTTFYWCSSSTQCTHIATEDTDGLCVGCEVRERRSDWSAPKKGTFYLKVCTDVNEQQPELDETNNCRFSSPITVK